MLTKTIQQSEYFPASCQAVYDLIMDAEKHSAFTGMPVITSSEVSGIFDVFEGYCTGFNIELQPGKRIVQAWHFREEGWPTDHYSICTFLFEPEGNGTRLTFTQTGVPEHSMKALEHGWTQYYWETMREYLDA